MPYFTYNSRGHLQNQLFIVRIYSSTLFVFNVAVYNLNHLYYINSTSSLDLVHRMKRSYGNFPSGITPLAKSHRSKQHSSSRGRKRLDFDAQQTLSSSVSSQQPQKFPKWTTEEETLLLEFLSRKCSEGKFTQWPSFPDKLFWEDAATFVTETSITHSQSCERTGMYS